MSNAARPPRAVLDADVIYSRVLHELFGRLALELRLLTLIWSEALLAEAERVLRERKPMPPDAARRWVDHLRLAFPDERVDLPTPQRIELSDLTIDPADEHVCALALYGEADLLVSGDRGYLARPLRQRGVQVVSPDDFLVDAVESQPQALVGVLRAQANVWGGGRPLPELLDAFDRAQASRFASRVRVALSG